MSQKPKALKGKVVLGYLLLFVTSVVSVWFIYTEILKIAVPDQAITGDNRKIIKISDAIAGLYAAEAVGRNSILNKSAKDFAAYNKLIDSINSQIEQIKKDSDPDQLGKFDTIQTLLERKKKSIREIIVYQKKYNAENAFDRGVRQINKVKDSLARSVKPVQIKNNTTQLRQFMTQLLTKKQLDSLSKLPVSNDALASAIEKMLTKVVVKENKIKFRLFVKEQKLQDENRLISDRLRLVLSALEKEILQKSYQKISRSEAAIDNTIKTIAWVGVFVFLVIIAFVWIIIRDLSNNQKYRQRLEVLNDEKEDLLRSKTMLLATVTHDIQTPLGSVIGFTDLMKNTQLNAKQQQYVDNIKHSSQYIVRLVNDLIDFSKLENNKITIEKFPFNFKDLIENTCRPLEHNATAKGIGLQWDIDAELNDNFISDPYRIKQILTNLVSNAIKFTQEGSVQIVAKTATDHIWISVIDTGIGIAKGQQKAVFKEFTQANSGIEKKFGGTGLGLTIAKRMLKLLGGGISLESEEGKGSIFTITLPKLKSALPNPDEEKEVSKQEAAFLCDKKILIVDDDPMQLALMKEIFSNYPAKVRTEVDAAKVESILESAHFDLLLSDIQMPKTDGFELVRSLRKSKRAEISGLPIIALSGKRDLAPNDFTSRGFTASHPKPLQLDVLLELIKAIFEKGSLANVQPISLEPKHNDRLYDLQSLNQFTQNDPGSLRMIIDTFVESSLDNCGQLTKAATEFDWDKMSALAHKMIPMLKQMEVYSIVALLEPIEDRKLQVTPHEMEAYAKNICEKMNVLFNELQLELSHL
jgi:signal transduction histidine kinase/DNA-binding NarL/FixJ family response regulator